jgi:F-type H+-transporting ATPase subunit b
MGEILTSLHLDWTPFVWHSLNFVVLTAVLWWLFFRPFARVVESRQERIRESLVRAEEVDRHASGLEAERQEVIALAHREAAEIRNRAYEQVHRYVAKSRATANADADRIRQRAAVRQRQPTERKQEVGLVTRRPHGRGPIHNGRLAQPPNEAPTPQIL